MPDDPFADLADPTPGPRRAARLSPDQIASTLRQAGWEERHIPTMTAIAQAESSGNPLARNPKRPDDSYGLLQVNRLAHPQFSPEMLRDPLGNAKAGLDVFKRQGLKAWSTYTSGAYKKYLRQSPRTQTSQQRDKFADLADDFADLAEPSGQNLPPPTSKSETRRPTKIPVTPAVAPSVPTRLKTRPQWGQATPQQQEQIRSGIQAFEALRPSRVSSIGELRRLEDEQRRHEQAIRDQVIAERSRRRGPRGLTPRGALAVAADPVGSAINLFRSESTIVAEEVKHRLAAEETTREPEVTEIRKEYGRMPPVERAIVGPLARGGAGILKLASGISSLGGYLPRGVVPPADKLSDWANRRAEIIESGAANTPLTEKEEEVTRGVPEKIATGVADLGVGLGEIILLKRATKLSFPQLLALEGALKNSDKPISEQAGRAAEGYALGSALDAHLGRRAGAALFGLPTAAQTGYEVSEGRMSPLDAAIQTGIQAGAGAILSPSRKATQRGTQAELPQVETQGRAAGTQTQDTSRALQDRPIPEARDIPTAPERGDSSGLPAVEPQRFYHKDWGEVEVLQDQSGARPGRVKVAEVADPTKQHFPKRSDLAGRGNQRMVPVRPEIPESESFLRDESGQPLTVYHQTTKEAEQAIRASGFDLSKARARRSDEGVPDGVFFKPDKGSIFTDLSDADSAELAANLRIKRPLEVGTREELVEWARRHDPEYAKLADKVESYDRPRAYENREKTDEYDNLIKDATAARARLTEALRREGYDGVIIERDVGGPQVTKTYIALDPKQVRLLEPEATQSPKPPSGWGSGGGTTDTLEEMARTYRAKPEGEKGPPQPLPVLKNGVTPEQVQEAWNAVSSRYPRIARLVKGIAQVEDLPSKAEALGGKRAMAAVDRNGILWINAGEKLSLENAFHEVTHLAQRARKRDWKSVQSEEAAKNRGLQATRLRKTTAETTAYGTKADLSLSQFVRKMGGIAPSEAHRGEIDRIRLRETGSTGLINGKAKQGNVKQTADIMMQSANDAGYRDPKTGQPFENPGDFLYAVERDVLGDKIRVRTGEEDFSVAEAEYYTEQEARTRVAESRNTFLESGRGAELFDRIVNRKASDAERAEYIELAEKAGISRAESEDLIAASREEVAGLQRTGREGATTPPRPAEQLGFVQEGLTQQEAPPPRLTQPDPADLTPQTRKMLETAETQAKLDEIKRRGMTVDDYARQPDLTGNVPKAEEVALLRKFESGRQVARPSERDIFADLEFPKIEITEQQYADLQKRLDAASEADKRWVSEHLVKPDPHKGIYVFDVSNAEVPPKITALLMPAVGRGESLVTEPDLTLEGAKLKTQNFGPGTMRAGEPLPEVKERKFGKRFVEDERIADEIRLEIGTAKYYEPIPNKITAAEASKLVEARGIGESMRIIRDEKNDLPHHIRSTMGQIVIQRLNQTYKNLKASGSGKAEGVLDQAADLAEWAMDYGTRLGQGVQSFAMWARLTPEGKLLTYKRAVAKARERHQKLYGEEVAEIVNTINKEGMTEAERAEALKNLFKTNKTARKIKTDIDKVIEAAKTGKLTDTLFYEIVGEKLGLPGYNRDVAEKITDLAHRIDEAPEGLPRNKLVQELQKFIAKQKGFDVADLPLGIFYGNILSGYNTQAVNFADTGLNVLSEINGLALNNPRAAAKIYSGLLRGFSEGRFDALLELTQGRMVTDGKWLEVPRLMEVAKFGQKGGVPIKTETKIGRGLKKVAESKIAIPLNAYKYVTRAMAASDALMFRAAKEARATLLAYRMAEGEGLKDSALETRVREILALDREGDFVAQARREGFTGTEAEFRAKELREMVRDKDLSADAADFAGEATYNHVPHGTLGLIAERVGKLAEDVKPLKLFVPFTRIVANVTNRGLNYTPYGYKRAFAGWGFGKNAEPLTAEGRRLMLTRATMGTAGMVLLAAMQETGLIAIHGNGPSDREKRRQLQNAGWRPYSLQIGDNYISYVYSPVGLGLSIVGNMKDAGRYHELEQKDIATKGAYAVARLGSTIFSQSFLSGLSRLFGALSERPDVSVNAVKQTLGGTAAAFTTPNIVRDVHRLFDNKAYQSNTLMEDLVRSTPFAALALKPQLNAFGEPVRLQRQRFFDKLTSDPAWRFVIQKGLRVPVPGRTTEMEDGKRITPEQYYKLLQTTGPEIKQWILDNQQNLQLLPEQDAQDELQSAATAIRKRALDEMRGKMVKPLKPPAPPKPEAPARP